MTKINDNPFALFMPITAVFIGKIRAKIYKHDKIELRDGEIVKPSENPTHTVTALKGTISGSSFEIELQDLSTGKYETITL